MSRNSKQARKVPESASIAEGGRRLIVPSALLFASGVAALVYQMLWIKQLSLVVGVDVHAVTTALSAFFGGLALGGYFLGKYSDRITSPMRLYAWLEIAVAVLAVGSTLLLSNAAPWFARLEDSVGILAWLLPFSLVGVPAILMGGTLPVLMRAITPLAGQLGTAGGRLYAANTTGAIAGVLLTPFLLIPVFGVRGASFAPAAINLVAAVAAFVASREIPAPSAVVKTTLPARPEGHRLALVLYSIAGGIALGYEVIWSQAIVQWTSTRTFAFAVVLATYLLGLVIGSALHAKRADRARDPWGQFGFLITAVGVIALVSLALAGRWLQPLQVQAATFAFHLTGQESFAMAARFATAALFIVLPPTILLGAAFPTVLRLTSDATSPGRDTGVIVALNTLGGIGGTMLTGYFLVPRFGLERSLAVLAIAAGVVGAVAVFRGTSVRLPLRITTLACGLASIIAAILISPDHLAKLLANARGGTLLYHEASSGGTVAVIEQGAPENRFRRLYIQGVSNSGDSLTSLRYMRLQALLPLIIHRGEPRSAMVIGLGTGITAGSLLYYPALDKRVCAELLPAVHHAVSQFRGNAGVATDPRIDLRLRDGRRELLRSGERYDMITLEPPPPSAAGVVNLYSTDFYQLAAKRLNPDGLVAQWLPLPTQTQDDTRSLVRSFTDVFPYATLWTTELHEMLLIGSLSPIELDPVKITARFKQPEVAKALNEVGIASPEALLSTWVTGREGLLQYGASAQPTTDDRPRIEYGGWVIGGEFVSTLQDLMALRTDPPVIHAQPTFVAEIERERTNLLSFYESGIYAYRKDMERWHKTLSWVLRKDPANPYFQWFVSRAKAAPADKS